jgi:hypothetical protein
MFRLSVVVALLLAGASASPARACSPARPNARVRISFLADSDLTSLARWAKETICVEYTFERGLAGRRLAQAVILSVTGHDAGTTFEILLRTMNLKVIGHGQKRSIVADGPETRQSREANEREKANLERYKVLDNIETEIKRKDESHYTTTRRGADAVMASLPSIARSMRVRQETKGGKPIGFRLVGLRSGALLTRVGLQNGDVVLSLNGTPLTSFDKAFEAYTRFRKTNVIDAAYVRDNKPLLVELKVE